MWRHVATVPLPGGAAIGKLCKQVSFHKSPSGQFLQFLQQLFLGFKSRIRHHRNLHSKPGGWWTPSHPLCPQMRRNWSIHSKLGVAVASWSRHQALSEVNWKCLFQKYTKGSLATPVLHSSFSHATHMAAVLQSCRHGSTRPDIISSLVEIFPPPSWSKWSKTAWDSKLSQRMDRVSRCLHAPAFNASFASWGKTGGGLTWNLSPHTYTRSTPIVRHHAAALFSDLKLPHTFFQFSLYFLSVALFW